MCVRSEKARSLISGEVEQWEDAEPSEAHLMEGVGHCKVSCGIGCINFRLDTYRMYFGYRAHT